jgi:hypothetical protein
MNGRGGRERGGGGLCRRGDKEGCVQLQVARRMCRKGVLCMGSLGIRVGIIVAVERQAWGSLEA